MRSQQKGGSLIRKLIARFILEEEGATSVEYGLMAALIVAVLVTLIALLGEGLYELYESMFDFDADEADPTEG